MALPSTAANYVEVWAQLRQRLAPAQLSNLQTNADFIAHYVHRNKLNGLSVDDVLSAVWALHAEGKILWDVEPAPAQRKTPEQTQAEFDARELKRIKKEAIENSKPFVHAETLAAQQNAEAEAKLQEKAQAEINRLILDYSVNGLPGRIDFTKTLAGQAALRGIKINRNGKVDWVLTLKVVRAAYNNDSPAEIIRAAERAVENYVTHDERERIRVRAEETKFGR